MTEDRPLSWLARPGGHWLYGMDGNIAVVAGIQIQPFLPWNLGVA
jgi:hypothetical protein